MRDSASMCTHEGCLTRAETGTNRCGRHRRCEYEGCFKWPRPRYCKAHGGGRQCLQEGCSTGAADGGPQYCIAHGGGRRCQKEGCTKAAASGGTPHCITHGGGRRCQHADCFKSVAKAAGSVFCYVPAWRGQARAAAAAAARRCADEWFVQTLARD
jgi:hypothetical protein